MVSRARRTLCWVTRGIPLVTCLTLFVVAAPAQADVPVAGQDSIVVQAAGQTAAAQPTRWRAALQVDYRAGTMSHDAMTVEFAPLGAAELQAGVARESRFAERSDLLKHEGYHALLGTFDRDWALQDAAADEIETTLWRYGIGGSQGYGHRLRIAGGRLVFSSSGSMAGYTLDVEDDAVALSDADSLTLARFTTKTRFGDSWSADVNLWFHRAVGIHVGYERAAVLPGFKFGYWSASGALYGLVRWGMEEFIVAVAEDSPGYVPILTFLMDSALGYAYYELRQEKMNWPFDTEPALSLDSFGLGLACRF